MSHHTHSQDGALCTWTSHKLQVQLRHKFLLDPVTVTVWVKNVGSTGVHAMWRVSVRRPQHASLQPPHTVPVLPLANPPVLLEPSTPPGPALELTTAHAAGRGAADLSVTAWKPPVASTAFAAGPSTEQDRGSGARGEDGRDNAHWAQLMLVTDYRGTLVHATQVMVSLG